MAETACDRLQIPKPVKRNLKANFLPGPGRLREQFRSSENLEESALGEAAGR